MKLLACCTFTTLHVVSADVALDSVVTFFSFDFCSPSPLGMLPFTSTLRPRSSLGFFLASAPNAKVAQRARTMVRARITAFEQYRNRSNAPLTVVLTCVLLLVASQADAGSVTLTLEGLMQTAR